MGLTIKNKLITDSNKVILDTDIKAFFAGLDNGTQILHINTFMNTDASPAEYTFFCIYADPITVTPVKSAILNPSITQY